VSRLLIQRGQCSEGSVLKVTFVSNDYHLKRIFEIQQLMDEQGLLRVLRERCAQHGVHLDIRHDLEAHVSALSAIRSVLAQNTNWSPYYHDFAQLQQWIEESDIEQAIRNRL